MGGGGFVFKDIVTGALKYLEQNGYLKISIGCVWGNGVLGRLVALWLS